MHQYPDMSACTTKWGARLCGVITTILNQSNDTLNCLLSLTLHIIAYHCIGFAMQCNGFIQIISHRPLKFKRVNAGIS